MDAELQCPICLDLCYDAVETSCCHHVFCEECIAPVDNKACPQCRLPFQVSASHLARRIIGNMQVECEYGCNTTVPRSELKEHGLVCEKRQFVCPAYSCSFVGLKAEFLKHLLDDHSNEILRNLGSCLNQPQNQREKYPAAAERETEDRIAIMYNSDGFRARLGSTGKFYCEATLDYDCDCCNGKCGPTNGCNCSACMKLDVTMRKLPAFWLVNSEGRSARKSGVHFYCGSRVKTRNWRCDGYCGPTDGPNCGSCQVLDRQVLNRYSTIWS